MPFRACLTPSRVPATLPHRMVAVTFAVLMGAARPAFAQVTPQATYGYDAAGNTATILYTDQTCVAHTYDSAGNRTATTITKADVPETPVWGDGVWGCNEWTP